MSVGGEAGDPSSVGARSGGGGDGVLWLHTVARGRGGISEGSHRGGRRVGASGGFGSGAAAAGFGSGAAAGEFGSGAARYLERDTAVEWGRGAAGG